MESSVYNVNVKDPTDFIRLTDDSKKRRTPLNKCRSKTLQVLKEFQMQITVY